MNGDGNEMDHKSPTTADGSFAGSLAEVFHDTTQANVDCVRGERASWSDSDGGREIDEAIANGRAHPPQMAATAKYDAANDMIVVHLRNGACVSFLRKSLQGLANAEGEDLAVIEIEGPGTGLFWPRLDVAHYLPGLMDNVFGTRSYMSSNPGGEEACMTPRTGASSDSIVQ